MAEESKENGSAEDFNKISIKIKNYLCFGEEPQGFESIKAINIIIGRNNSGKSRLLDMLKFAISPELLEDKGRIGKESEVIASIPLLEHEVRMASDLLRTKGNIHDWHHYRGKTITISLKKDKVNKFIEIQPPQRGETEMMEELAKVVRNPFKNRIINKIDAERDIEADKDTSETTEVESNGDGATTIIYNFINNSTYDREIIDSILLNDLNRIIAPDACFQGITVRESENIWEISLKEKDKGWIKLSESGSGLKTILLVLINILLVPKKGINL